MIVLNKVEGVAAEHMAELRASIARLNELAPVLPTNHSRVALDSTPHKARWQAGDENAGWDLREREGGGVHVVPRSAPGLCLTAPPLLPTE